MFGTGSEVSIVSKNLARGEKKMASKIKLQEVGKEALQVMKDSVRAAELFGKVTVADVEEKIRQLANKNGFRFEDVEKEAQRLSLLEK